jgi:hypothetical protein
MSPHRRKRKVRFSKEIVRTWFGKPSRRKGYFARLLAARIDGAERRLCRYLFFGFGFAVLTVPNQSVSTVLLLDQRTMNGCCELIAVWLSVRPQEHVLIVTNF